MAYKQAQRTVKIGTTLGEDAVHLLTFTGEEEISRLFRFDLTLTSVDASIKAEDVVGHNLTFSVEQYDGKIRYFNGFVQKFAAGDEGFKGHRGYAVTIVPWFWFLTQIHDCRIFQEKSVVEIIEEVFGNRGFSDYELKIEGQHEPREYCVQYRESDFAFLSRLMEEEGIFYYFRHEDGKHVMVIGDGSAAWEDCHQSVVDFPVDQHTSVHITPHLTAWDHIWQFQSGAVAHTDYNFKTPGQNLLTNEKTLMKFPNGTKYERFDYPGRYPDKNVGKPLVRVRMEEIESAQDTVMATSTCKSFTPGGRFSIGRHRVRAEEGRSYVIKSIHHTGYEPDYDTGGGEGGGFEYTNSFQCFPDSVPYRPARTTERAVMRGCQTAVVTGPSGEEIYTDEHGRVKVKFHWDRWGENNEKSSCWIRVSHQHAGKGWGYIDLPRVGEEVIVDFLEGDPDQPLIVGRVYNGQNKTPFALPDEKTRRGNTTKTYKGSGYNELSMDDTEGKEQIRIHAQYNMDTAIEHDETLWVGNNRTKSVDVDEQTSIGSNRSETVGKNETITIGENRVTSIGKNETLTVGGVLALNVGSNVTVSVSGDVTSSTGKNSQLAVGSSQTTSIGSDDTLTVGGNRSTNVAKNDSISVGKQLVIEAGNEIILKTGSATLIMKKNGDILLKGKNIKLDASAKVDVKASSDVKIKGSKITQN